MTELNESIVASLDRRRMLQMAGATGLAGALAACGGGSDTDGSTVNDGVAEPDDSVDAAESDTEQPEDSSSDEGDEQDADDGADDTAAEALAATGDVPVGGGVIVGGVVITQPAGGDFRAFSSTCTHQGCTVSDVSDGIISCPCHGSQYSAEDGSVERGPAAAALPEVAITVEGEQILRG